MCKEMIATLSLNEPPQILFLECTAESHMHYNTKLRCGIYDFAICMRMWFTLPISILQNVFHDCPSCDVYTIQHAQLSKCMEPIVIVRTVIIAVRAKRQGTRLPFWKRELQHTIPHLKTAQEFHPCCDTVEDLERENQATRTWSNNWARTWNMRCCRWCIPLGARFVQMLLFPDPLRIEQNLLRSSI